MPRDNTTIISLGPDLELWSATSIVAGMKRETDATTINEDIVDAAVALKFDSRLLIPPARKQQPRTWVISYVRL